MWFREFPTSKELLLSWTPALLSPTVSPVFCGGSCCLCFREDQRCYRGGVGWRVPLGHLGKLQARDGLRRRSLSWIT